MISEDFRIDTSGRFYNTERKEKLEELGNPESLTTEQITREYKRTGDGSPFLFTS